MRAGAFVVVVIHLLRSRISDDLRYFTKFSDVFIENFASVKILKILNAVLRASRAKQFLVTFFFFILKESHNMTQSRINYHILW